MLKKLRKSNQGFTIIEVLIVLAIAALILLIIFFAVPALQRNSRNTQIRNDANVVLGFVNDYAANNNGGLPAYINYAPATGVLTMGNTTSCTTLQTTAAGKIRSSLTVTCGTANPANPNSLVIDIGHICNGSALGGAVNSRAVSVGFKTETAGAPVDQCIQS